jgi:2-keto-4-pentenoate hydratase/2-oxohepta-3-ene-1,7-dioic acid hydratase in catechol pathway
MKLLQFYDNSEVRFGVKHESAIIDIAAAAKGQEGIPTSLGAVIGDAEALGKLRAFVDGLPDTGDWLLDESLLKFAPCVAIPEKIICIGLNYKKHAAETGKAVPQSPMIFAKYANTLNSANATVSIPPNLEKTDYEAELAVVIGRTARNVSVEDALGYVLGYCTANDISGRDWQRRTQQFLLGKTPDNFLPIGPYLVTADEVSDPQNLSIKTWHNGELRQNSNTSDMVFSVAESISYLSEHFTLKPGDVISTGTPEGVIAGMENPVWIKAGDKVIVEVEGLGQCVTIFE